MKTDDMQCGPDAVNTSSSDANVPQSITMQSDIFPVLDNVQPELLTPEQQAQAIVEQFLDWATNPRLAVLDTETTGVGPGDQVIEIGIVDAYGRTLMNQRVKPTVPVSPAAQQIHGISMADLEGCPSFDQVWPQLWEILQAYDVVIYNKAFDLERVTDSLNATMPNWHSDENGHNELFEAFWAIYKRTGCVMEAYAPIYGHWNDYFGSYRWAKLSVACDEQNVDTSDLKAHEALSDSRGTLRLIRATAEIDPTTLTWIGHEDENGGEDW